MPPLRVGRCLGVALLLLAACAESAESQAAGGPPRRLYTVAYGVIFECDPVSRDIREVARIDPTATELAADSSGGHWGRYRESALARYDPAQGAITEIIPLQDAPYRILVASDGSAYVSHNTRTARGFTLSVVDLAAARVSRRIQGIPGIVTDMTFADGMLYLATLGVEQPGWLALSRLDPQSGRLSELYRAPKGGFLWRLARHGETLYLIPTRSAFGSGKSSPLPSVVAYPLRGGAPRERLLRGADEIDRITGGGYLLGDILLLPCRSRSGGSGIALVDLGALLVTSFVPVSCSIDEILYAGQERCVAKDNPLTAGPEGVALVFINLKEGREAAVVPLLRHAGN